MKEINDLLNSPERIRIFKLVESYDDLFSAKDVLQRLQKEGVSIGFTTIQTLLRGLSYREYLQRQLVRTTARRGRSNLYFKKNGEYNFPIQAI